MQILYVEYEIDPLDYERARAVIDAYVRSDITDADKFLEYIKWGDQVREAMDVPGARVDLNSDGSMRVDVPDNYDFSGFDEIGIEGAEHFEQIPYHGIEHDARNYYKTVIVPAESVPEALKDPVGADQPYAQRSPNAVEGSIGVLMGQSKEAAQAENATERGCDPG